MLRPCLFHAIALSLLCAGCKKKATQAGEILVEAERVAASRTDTPRDIQPYDEAISWHEYLVKRVINGDVKAPKIRVAHWTVVAAKPVPVSVKKGEVVQLKLTPFD